LEIIIAIVIIINIDYKCYKMGCALSTLSQTKGGSSNASSSSNIASASNTLPFPKDGIRLSSINVFYNACGGKDKLIGLTTTEVNEKFLKSITESSQSSYCELLKSQGDDCVDGASVFISHAWKYEFLHVIDALEYHLRDTPDIMIWFDLFSNNQHRATGLDFNWWCNTFKSAIRDFGRTVLNGTSTLV
jgi:hypothetical protein